MLDRMGLTTGQRGVVREQEEHNQGVVQEYEFKAGEGIVPKLTKEQDEELTRQAEHERSLAGKCSYCGYKEDADGFCNNCDGGYDDMKQEA